MTDSTPRRLVVGISGASGSIFGIRLLQVLQQTDIETHLVISKAGELTIAYETDYKTRQVRDLAKVNHPIGDIAASISSGSFRTMGMVIAPCSMRTMSEIASGVTSSLLSRAADVALKERRRLVLAVRESPLHTGHLRTMAALSEMGAVISPLTPAFYNRPQNIDDILNHSVGRLLDLFDIDVGVVKRWTGERPAVDKS